MQTARLPVHGPASSEASIVAEIAQRDSICAVYVISDPQVLLASQHWFDFSFVPNILQRSYIRSHSTQVISRF